MQKLKLLAQDGWTCIRCDPSDVAALGALSSRTSSSPTGSEVSTTIGMVVVTILIRLAQPPEGATISSGALPTMSAAASGPGSKSRWARPDAG